MINLAVSAIFLLCVVSANLLAEQYGMWMTLLSSFLFIGVEMTCRDYLNSQITKIHMIFIITLAGGISYFINVDSLNIAIASSVAITASCILDYLVFNSMRSSSWFKKSNVSNLISSSVDSILFTTIAFGSFYSLLVLGHIGLKLLGGFVFTLLVVRLFSVK